MDLKGQETTPEVALFCGFACGTIPSIVNAFSLFSVNIVGSRNGQAADGSHVMPNDSYSHYASKENSDIQGEHTKSYIP